MTSLSFGLAATVIEPIEEKAVSTELAPELALKLKAKVLYLYGHSHIDISRQLGIKVQNIRYWSKTDRWDRARAAVLREINAKVLRKVQKDFAGLVNDQSSKMAKLRSRLWAELEGFDPDHPENKMIDPLSHVPVGTMLVGSGEKLIGHLIKLMALEKDFTIQTMGMITEAMPKLNPRDVKVGDKEEETDDDIVNQ